MLIRLTNDDPENGGISEDSNDDHDGIDGVPEQRHGHRHIVTWNYVQVKISLKTIGTKKIGLKGFCFFTFIAKKKRDKFSMRSLTDKRDVSDISSHPLFALHLLGKGSQPT